MGILTNGADTYVFRRPVFAECRQRELLFFCVVLLRPRVDVCDDYIDGTESRDYLYDVLTEYKRRQSQKKNCDDTAAAFLFKHITDRVNP